MSDFSATPGPHSGMPAGRAEQLDEQDLESVLSSLADHDIAEHARIYEKLLGSLQHELNRSENG